MRRERIESWGRGALVAATLLVGIALFTTVWATYRGVAKASEIVVLGQADALVEGVRSELVRDGELPNEPSQWSLRLGHVQRLFASRGLLYLALLTRERKLLADSGWRSVGRRELEAAVRGVALGVPQEVRDRVRVVTWRPLRRPLATGQRWIAPVAGAPSLLVIELDPSVARALDVAARRTLIVGSVSAGLFVVLALLLVRWIVRRAAVQLRREHEKQLASLGQMSAVLAHEMRNPLASLKGNAQLLARGLPTGERTHAKAERVVSEATRLESLVNGLLEFARTGELRRSLVDPVALVRSAIEPMVERGAERVELDAATAPALWHLDPERMRQVLANLIHNALLAGPGTVHVTVAQEGTELVFVVADRGPGIAKEELERVFEPFFTRRTQGTGLGLPVARRFVDLHGGTLVAGNRGGGGAELTVRIPE